MYYAVTARFKPFTAAEFYENLTGCKQLPTRLPFSKSFCS